jgi:hypothetical protein
MGTPLPIQWQLTDKESWVGPSALDKRVEAVKVVTPCSSFPLSIPTDLNFPHSDQQIQEVEHLQFQRGPLPASGLGVHQTFVAHGRLLGGERGEV